MKLTSRIQDQESRRRDPNVTATVIISALAFISLGLVLARLCEPTFSATLTSPLQ